MYGTSFYGLPPCNVDMYISYDVQLLYAYNTISGYQGVKKS